LLISGIIIIIIIIIINDIYIAHVVYVYVPKIMKAGSQNHSRQSYSNDNLFGATLYITVFL